MADIREYWPFGLALVGGLAFAANAKAKPPPRKKKKSRCPPLPALDPSVVLPLSDELVEKGVRGPRKVAALVAAQLYPSYKGVTIQWPKTQPFDLPDDTPEPVQCRFQELIDLMEELGVPSAEPGSVFNELIKTTPTPGHFFKIKQGWILSGTGAKSIAFQAIRKVSPNAAADDQIRIRYIRCMSAGDDYNRRLYGSPRPSEQFSASYTVRGQNLSAAFDPINANAISYLTKGQFPPRTITAEGQPTGQGSDFGLLWLPPLEREDLDAGNVGCLDNTWDDGRPTVDPPPQIMELLQA